MQMDVMGRIEDRKALDEQQSMLLFCGVSESLRRFCHSCFLGMYIRSAKLVHCCAPLLLVTLTITRADGWVSYMRVSGIELKMLHVYGDHFCAWKNGVRIHVVLIVWMW